MQNRPGRRTTRSLPESFGGSRRWTTRTSGYCTGRSVSFPSSWGGIAVLIMRTELLTPGTNLFNANIYNSLLTTHGITMLFLFGTPIIAAFSNYFIPLAHRRGRHGVPAHQRHRVLVVATRGTPHLGRLPRSSCSPASNRHRRAGRCTRRCRPVAAAERPHTVRHRSAGVDLMLLGLHLSGVSATHGCDQLHRDHLHRAR